MLDQVKKTWKKSDGDMKIHYSQQNPLRKKGAHGYTTLISEFQSFLNEYDFSNIDIMLEVKDKDISTIKINNYLSLINNDLDSKIISSEINNYSLFLYEHFGNTIVDKIKELQETLNLLELYSLVDDNMYLERTDSSFLFALNKSYSLLRSYLNQKEINHYEKTYKKKEYLKCKEYLKKLAEKHDLSQCGYYFFY